MVHHRYLEAVRAIHRLVQIRRVFNDWRVLGALVTAATDAAASEGWSSFVRVC